MARFLKRASMLDITRYPITALSKLSKLTSLISLNWVLFIGFFGCGEFFAIIKSSFWSLPLYVAASKWSNCAISSDTAQCSEFICFTCFELVSSVKFVVVGL